MATNNTTSTTNNIGCNCIADTAFVPGDQGKPSLADLLKGVKVTAKRPGTPEQGIHSVLLDSEPTIHRGNDGNPYLVFVLHEPKTGLVWKAFVSADGLAKALEDISFFNNGMLAGKKGLTALQFLYSHEFSVWTLQTEKGKTATYFNEDKHGKRLYAMEKNREKQRPEDPAPEK